MWRCHAPKSKPGNSKECLDRSLVMNECAFNVWHFTVGAANEYVCSHNQQGWMHRGDFAKATTRPAPSGREQSSSDRCLATSICEELGGAKGVFTTEATESRVMGYTCTDAWRVASSVTVVAMSKARIAVLHVAIGQLTVTAAAETDGLSRQHLHRLLKHCTRPACPALDVDDRAHRAPSRADHGATPQMPAQLLSPV
jgi:hypothetical protein